MSNLPANLIEVLSERSQQIPDQTAYIFLEDGKAEKERVTYLKLYERVAYLGSYLQTVTQPGDRLLLIYPAGLDFVVAFLSCLYAGAIAVPVYPPRPNRPLDRLSRIALDTDGAIALTTSLMLDKLKSKIAESSNLKALTWLETDTFKPTAENRSPRTIEPSALAFLQYTSGSTGDPKGVMVSHSNLIHNLQVIQTGFELTTDSVSVTWLPHYHDMGLVDGILEPLYTGCLGILMPPTAFLRQPICWLQAIAKYKGTHSGGPNVGYDLCVQKITLEQLVDLDLSSWVSAYNGAEPIRAETLKAFTKKFDPCGFQGKYFYPCYGMAESTLMITGVDLASPATFLDVSSQALEQNKVVSAEADNPDSKQLVGCGHSYLDTQVEIVNPETLQISAAGEIGEIWVSGDSIAQGYWQRPETTAASFGVELGDRRFFRTGDLGFLYNGELFITGRLKDVLIIWGRNIYPQDLEFVVADCHPALANAGGAAFSIGDSSSSVEQLVIVQEVERTARRDLDADAVFAAIREAIAAEFDVQVQGIALIKPVSIPKTSSGKIQRQACKRKYLEGSLDTIAAWEQSKITPVESQAAIAPNIASNQEITETTIQTWLIQKLAVVQQVDVVDIDINESFAQYGLDSSVMLELTGELGEWLNYETEPTLMWEYTDIASLAEYLIEELNSN